MSSLGHNLKELRHKQSLNQKDLSDRSGVSQATISRIETGRVQPRSSALKSIADCLNVSTDDLMDDNGHSTQAPKDPLHQIAETLNAFVIDENGHLRFISQTLADSLGYRGEELLAKDVIELLFASESHSKAQRMIASGSSNTYEALMKHSDDSFLPVEITNVNINEKECLVIVRDITTHRCQQGAFRVLQAGCEADKVRDLEKKVVRTLGNELEAMGVQFEAVDLQVIDEQRDLLFCYRAYSQERGYRSLQNVVNLQDSLDHFASLRRLVRHWNRDEVLEHEADEDYRQMTREVFSDQMYRPGLLIDVPFAQGMLGLGLPMGDPSNPEQLATILGEFTHSISLVVKRLFKLQSLREKLASTTSTS